MVPLDGDPERAESRGVSPLEPSTRMGFLAGAFQVPNDFDVMDQEDIEAVFYDSDVSRKA